jgi:7,8-dihydropterin-6-yl-methyl-4-(beta-D-ribofuranosyl)aminobenzene 5'-phosphate synthase
MCGRMDNMPSEKAINSEIEVTVLIEDKPAPADGGSPSKLKHEHGLSFFIKTESANFLFDTGQSNNFAVNAEKTGIDLTTADFAVISHGHYDHGGGIGSFLELNKTAPVFLHEKAALPVYFSRKAASKEEYIGIPQKPLKEFPERFSYISSHIKAASGIHILCCSEISDRSPIFKNESFFKRDEKGEHEETFMHEIFVVIERDTDFILISGCSHSNIISIIRHAQYKFPGKTISGIVGGFHLPDVTPFTETHKKEVYNAARKLDSMILTADIQSKLTSGCSPKPIRTGHCTGDKAKLIIKEVLGNKVDFFFTGETFFL